MDSDEDELGVYDASSTPYRVNNYVDVTVKAAKPNGRAAVAGPSSKPPGKTRTKVRKQSPTPRDDNGEVEDEAEIVEAPAPPARRSRPKRAASREPAHVGAPRSRSAPRSKGKGKAKANDAHESSPEVMDIDNLEEIRADGDGEAQEVPRPSSQQSWNLKQNQRHLENSAWKKKEERYKRELERLQKRCQDALNQRDNLASQIEEAFEIRNTEAETNAEQQANIYESRIQTQEQMIQELTSQLARVDSLTREGKTSTLHFLTREAADEERRGVERQAEKLKQGLSEKDKVIAERDATIREQADEIRELKRELSAEIERSKTLASSRPNGRDDFSRSRIVSGPRSGVKLDGVKTANAHKLYEDLTNILILDCKCEISTDTDEEQWVYTCLYSPADSTFSLAFSLRAYSEPGEDGEKVWKVAYTPKEMSDKSPDLLSRLDFLADEFTFHRKQLDVFLDKLYCAMSESAETADYDR